MNSLCRVRTCSSGATAIEYGLIVGLISGSIVAASALIDGEIAGAFGSIATALTTAFN